MAEKGIFRSAMNGFNKKEVLEYIDQITAAWDAERQDLLAQMEAADNRTNAAEQAAIAARAAVEEAKKEAAAAQEQLAAMGQQLNYTTSELDTKNVAIQSMEELLQEKETALQTSQAALSAANAEIAELTVQRDEAISAVAEAREQLAELEATTARLTEAEALVAGLQQENDRYKAVLGTAETAQEHVNNIVRPFIEQANRQADETLDAVQAVLAGVLAQLGELQGSVEQRRQALHRCKDDSDSRLSAAFGDWLALARSAANEAPATPADTGHFFR
ncbi:MAG: hypothetical protein IJ518_07305 [Clostridia bacterium]|nr:hypothetical protein [Clostridia bacterium]